MFERYPNMEFSKDFKVFLTELKEVLAQAEKEAIEECGYEFPPVVGCGSSKRVDVDIFKCLEISHKDSLMIKHGHQPTLDEALTKLKAQTIEFVNEVRSHNPVSTFNMLGLLSAKDTIGLDIDPELLTTSKADGLLVRQFYLGSTTRLDQHYEQELE